MSSLILFFYNKLSRVTNELFAVILVTKIRYFHGSPEAMKSYLSMLAIATAIFFATFANTHDFAAQEKHYNIFDLKVK
jgi:hypothetical protein